MSGTFNLPSTLLSIGEQGFRNCSSVTDINVPDNTRTIGTQAFRGVNNVNYNGDATGLPWCAKNINGELAPGFYAWRRLASGSYGYDLMCHITKEDVERDYSESSGCLKAILPTGLTTDVRMVILPNSVERVGDYAFYYLSNMTVVKMGNNVKTIGDYAFTQCGVLNLDFLSDSIETVGAHAFEGCRHDRVFSLPANIVSIHESAFDNMVGNANYAVFRGIDFSACTKLENIGKNAFRNAKGGSTVVASVTIPATVTEIGEGAFSGNNITTMTVLGTSVAFGINAFKAVDNVVYSGDPTGYAWGAKKLNGQLAPGIYGSNDYLHATITKEDVEKDYTYSASLIDDKRINVSTVKKIIIPNDAQKLGNYTFYNAQYIESVIFPSPNALTTIGNSTFSNSGYYGNLDITVPDTVTKIGSYAFSGVPHITYHGSATGSPWGARSFN